MRSQDWLLTAVVGSLARIPSQESTLRGRPCRVPGTGGPQLHHPRRPPPPPHPRPRPQPGAGRRLLCTGPARPLRAVKAEIRPRFAQGRARVAPTLGPRRVFHSLDLAVSFLWPRLPIFPSPRVSPGIGPDLPPKPATPFICVTSARPWPPAPASLSPPGSGSGWEIPEEQLRAGEQQGLGAAGRSPRHHYLSQFSRGPWTEQGAQHGTGPGLPASPPHGAPPDRPR